MSATRSPLKAAINARSSLQEDARKREALAVPGSKAKSMWKMALDHVTHPFVEEDLKVKVHMSAHCMVRGNGETHGVSGVSQ